MPLDLADDGRDGISGELDAEVGVELVDRLEQPDRGGLDQIVGGLAASGVAVRQVAGQRQPGLDGTVPHGRAVRMPGRQGRHGLQELIGVAGGALLNERCGHDGCPLRSYLH
jgi:hypothetical protein